MLGFVTGFLQCLMQQNLGPERTQCLMLCLNLPPARAAHLPPLLAASVGSHPLVFMLGGTGGLRLLLAFWTL